MLTIAADYEHLAERAEQRRGAGSRQTPKRNGASLGFANTKAPASTAGAPALQLNSTSTLRTYIDATLWVGKNQPHGSLLDP
jgi:hypothetical protein